MKPSMAFSLILLLALLAGCATPTPLPPTETSVPTKTPIPTATFTPTATPYPPLTTNGPYFAYLKKIGDKQKAIVYLDANGTGRKEVLLPENISQQMYDLNNLSPDGKWLAYYTGEPDSYSISYGGGIPSEGPYDLALNLYSLETRESKLITPLLSEDFPNNFRQQLDIFKKTEMPGEFEQLPDDYNVSTLYGTFLVGIDSLSWSSDGRHLAFAGQMNGLSSDLYVYDMETQTIRQLSSGSEEIYWISWSPDGQGILHGSTYSAGMGMECRTYIADLDGQSVRYLSEGMRCFPPDDWLDEFTFLENESENSTGRFHLRSVNTQTGGITMYWEGAYGIYAVDAQNGFILLNAYADTYPFPTNGFEAGLYLVNINTRRKTKVLDDVDLYSQYFGLKENDFVVLGRKNYFINTDGTFKQIESQYHYEIISLAPDRQHWVGIGRKISVFTVDDLLIREISLPKNYCDSTNIEMMTWSLDSSGFFFYCSEYISNDTNYSLLYFVNLLDGDPILVESDWWSWYKWLSNYK